MNNLILLRSPEEFPSVSVLKGALGDDIYEILESFLGTVTGAEYGLNAEWRFYNDGKSWLCKVAHKKKTVLWLSVWEGFFRAGFFFTENHIAAISELNIDGKIKDEFTGAKPVGRLLPMIFDVSDKGQLADLLTVVRFKKDLK